jgi:chromosome segregation ATPase
MAIETQRQLDNTRAKLRELEKSFAKMEQAAAADAHVRELTLGSLKKTINQFQKEIARYEARVSQGARGLPAVAQLARPAKEPRTK